MYTGSITQMYTGSITHMYTGSITHMYTGSITQMYTGSITHMYTGSITQMYTGSITHMYTGSITQRYTGSITPCALDTITDTRHVCTDISLLIVYCMFINTLCRLEVKRSNIIDPSRHRHHDLGEQILVVCILPHNIFVMWLLYIIPLELKGPICHSSKR